MSDDDRPVLRVIRGAPEPEDLAVITAVLASAGRSDLPDQSRPAQSPWATYWRQAAPPPPPGPGAWRASLQRR